jgi:hypothetical protein
MTQVGVPGLAGVPQRLAQLRGPGIFTDEEEEEEMAKDTANWRAIAFAHEYEYYLGLLHTHAAEPSEDASYTDHCDDTDIADPHNVMTQGKRG